jgi:hypothetical protein
LLHTTLASAVRCFDTTQHAGVFAVELDSHTRNFCCLPMGALLDYVEHMLQAGLWPAVYEVLLPGSVCKLYLDVEYNRELNPELNTGRR